MSQLVKELNKRILANRLLAQTSCASSGLFHLTKRGLRSDLLSAENLTSKIVIRPGGRQSVSGVVATVFGSTGFLGRYVVNRLGRIGCQVIIPYRGDGSNTRHLKLMSDYGQIVPLPFDLFDENSVRRAVSRSNMVVNLLGSQHETSNFSFNDIHVKATYRIAKMAREAGVERFVHLSTVGYDLHSESEWIRTKSESESIVRGVYPEATILRCSTIYGEEDSFLNRLASLANTSPVIPLIDGGMQKLQPIFVQDVANAVLNVITSPDTAGKTYQLGGPKVITLEQVIHMILDEIVQRSNIVNLNYNLALFYGYLFEFLPAKWRLLSRDMVKQMKIDLVVSKGALTLADLGLVPQTFESSVPRILLRYRGARVHPSAPKRSPLTDI